MNKEVN